MKSTATFSPDGRYRYELTRDWSDSDPVKNLIFIGLNPSTADAYKDDPTIKSCIRLAKHWNYNKITMINLYAYRATRPKDMIAAKDRLDEENLVILKKYANERDTVVAAWGKNCEPCMQTYAKELFPTLHCLGLNLDNSPKHPLYISTNTTLKIYKE